LQPSYTYKINTLYANENKLINVFCIIYLTGFLNTDEPYWHPRYWTILHAKIKFWTFTSWENFI